MFHIIWNTPQQKAAAVFGGAFLLICATWSWSSHEKLSHAPNLIFLGDEKLSHGAVVSTNAVSAGYDFRFTLLCLYGFSESDKRLAHISTANFTYPDDADEHFDHIHTTFQELFNAQSPHAYANYRGPWVENIWIDEFSARLKEGRKRGSSLKDIFGVYVPLLFPWVDLWVNKQPGTGRGRYPEEFKERLRQVLRPDVVYVTVSQSDSGIYGDPAHDFQLHEFTNILVLSAGGYGHVPIPLMAASNDNCSSSLRGNQRKYFVSFPGSLSHAPDLLRQKMADTVISSIRHEVDLLAQLGRTNSWRDVICESRFVLCPRGFGRTSFRLSESVQFGRIPVLIFSDIPWVPYPHLFQKFGISTSIDNLHRALEDLYHLDDVELMRKEAFLNAIKTTHFTYAGTMNQISLFLLSGHKSSDLRCEKIPPTLRDDHLGIYEGMGNSTFKG